VFDSLKILIQYLLFRHFRNFTNRTALLSWQKKKIIQYRKSTLRSFPFFEQFTGEGLEGLPITNKQIMEEHFQGLNSLGLDYKTALQLAQDATSPGTSALYQGVTIGMSSGTTGKRSLFIVSPRERRSWLAAVLSKIFGGNFLEKHKVALLLSANSQLYKTMDTSSALEFRFFDLKKPISDHVEVLNSFQPTLLVAPSSVLSLLADQQSCGNLKIAPGKIFSGAEVLTNITRSKVRDAWNMITHQIYQATEGFLGITCSLGTLHLNEEFMHFEREWIDKERRAFNPIITDFTRTTQSMTRYRMNDILIETHEPCPCGSPLLSIERIEGRCDDILIFQSIGTNKSLYFPDEIRAVILDSSSDIQDFHIEQLDEATLHMAVLGKGWEKAAKALQNKIVGKSPKIRKIPYSAPDNHGVKMRRIRRSPSISLSSPNDN